MAAILVVATVSLTPSLAQTQQLPKADRHSTIGDSPDIEVPVARDLSAELTTGAIDRAMKKVADWQMSRSQDDLNTDWTFAVLEAGLVAASDTLNDPSYRDAVAAMGAKRGWTLGRRLTHADDQVVAQSYLEIYEHDHKAEQITPLKQQFDTLKVMPDDPQRPVWWWCDALFMAPPAWAGLSRLTGDRSYLDYMDRQCGSPAAGYSIHKNISSSETRIFFTGRKRTARRYSGFEETGGYWAVWLGCSRTCRLIILRAASTSKCSTTCLPDWPHYRGKTVCGVPAFWTRLHIHHPRPQAPLL
jgi:hypothetical protein